MKKLKAIIVAAACMLCTAPFLAVHAQETESEPVQTDTGQNTISEEGLAEYQSAQHQARLRQKEAQASAFRSAASGNVILDTSE